MLSHLRVSESSCAYVLDDHDWALSGEFALEPSIFAEAFIVLVVSEATSSDRNSNFSRVQLASIKFQKLKEVDMKHYVSFMLLVLLLQEVNDHIDEHERADTTLSCLVERALPQVGFEHKIKGPQFREHGGGQNLNHATLDSIVPIESNIDTEPSLIVFEFEDRDTCVDSLNVLERLHFQEPLMYFSAQ